MFSIATIGAPGIDFASENVAGLGLQLFQNGNPLQIRVRRWQTGRTTLAVGQGLQTSGRYFEIETSSTLAIPVSRSSIRLEYTEDDLYGIAEDSLVVLRSGNLAGPWTVLSNVRTPIRPDPARFQNQLTIEGVGLTLNFAASTARYWAIAAPAQMTSVQASQNLSAEAVSIAACFPNPARDVLQVHYRVRENTPVEITLNDLTGRTIAHLLKTQHLTGEYTLQIQTSSLTSGAYILRVQTPHSSARELVRVVR